jgi:hypothetical protein
MLIPKSNAISWNAIWTLVKVSNIPCQNLNSEIWAEKLSAPIWFSRTTWSFYCIKELRKKVFSKEKILVYVPIYICDSSLQKLRGSDVDLIFYDIDRNLDPSEESIARLVREKGAPDILICVHYFGDYKNFNQQNNFCKKYDAWLIEDATHIGMPKSKQYVGDFICFSPYKHLNVPNGALLLKNSSISLDGYEEKIYSIASALPRKNQALSYLENFIWVLKKIMQKIGIDIVNYPKEIDLGSFSSNNYFQNIFLNRFERRILDLEMRSIKISLERKKQSYKIWAELLSIFSPLGVTVPSENELKDYFFIECDSAEIAEKLFKALRRKIPIQSWPDLPCEYEELYPSIYEVASKKIFFPLVDINTNKEKIDIHTFLTQVLNQLIKVKEINFLEWRYIYNTTPNKDITQAWEYGLCKQSNNTLAIRLKITTIHGHVIGLAQVIMYKKLRLRFYRINRGPILKWDYPMIGPSDSLIRLGVLNSTLLFLKKRYGGGLAIISPAIIRENYIERMILKLNYFKCTKKNWSSSIIDLAFNEDILMKNLKPKWRNTLKKGMSLVKIDDIKINELEESAVIKAYSEFKSLKNFNGIDNTLLCKMLSVTNKNWKHYIISYGANNLKNVTPNDLIVLITSGQLCTYLIGINTSYGRKIQLNSVLLWIGLLHAKRNGCKYFDLGGIEINKVNDNISKFKLGINGKNYTYVGDYIKLV